MFESGHGLMKSSDFETFDCIESHARPRDNGEWLTTGCLGSRKRCPCYGLRQTQKVVKPTELWLIVHLAVAYIV